MSSTPEAPTFGQEHFGQAYLGDKRRTRCLIDLADRFARHPGGTLPQKLKDPLALRRCYDLMKVPAVTHQSVLTPHRQCTLGSVLAQDGVVLEVHDGSELNFSQLTSLRDQLGQVGNGSGKGYQCLNSLAVLPKEGRVLGLVNQILFKRPEVPKNETRAQRRDRADRESLRWLRAVDGVEEATARCRRRLRLDGVVSDGEQRKGVGSRARGFGGSRELGAFVDRSHLGSRQDRLTRIHDQGQATRLHDHLRTLAEQGRRTIQLSDRPGRPARQASVAVTWAAVWVDPPANPRGQYRQAPLRVWALRVWEPEPPAGAEAVEWFLLTNGAVEGLGQAWERADWYICRWVVEEFHKAQKTGCNIEAPQFTCVERLEPMIALLSVLATTLLGLRSDSRDEQAKDRPATERVDQEYVEILSGWRYQEKRALTLREFFLALARRGGHQNRNSDGPPGWLVLWRGWTTLQAMVEGARALRYCQATPLPQGQPPVSSDPDG